MKYFNFYHYYIKMNTKCWKEELSQTYKRLYYIDLETGKSRWSKPSTKLLPLGWEMHISRKLGTAYYGFSETGVTQWDEPTGPIEKPKSPPAGWKILNSPCNNIYYGRLTRHRLSDRIASRARRCICCNCGKDI
jgi:hypothetical protein